MQYGIITVIVIISMIVVMNATVSCAGERLLFAWLHWLLKDKDILTERERLIRFFDEQQESRRKLCQARRNDV